MNPTIVPASSYLILEMLRGETGYDMYRSLVTRGTLISACLLAGIARAEDWPHWGGPRGDETWHAPKLAERWPAGGLPTAWKAPIGGGYGGVSVSAGRVYVMDREKAPAEQERVLCFDAASGKPLWTHAYAVKYGNLDYGNGPRATPTLFDGRVYTLGAMGHFFCLDAATGRPLWSKDFVADFGAKIPQWGLAASAVIWQDLVFVHPGVKGGCIMAFDRLSGKETWRTSEDRAGYATPVLIDSPSGPQLIAWTPQHILGIAPSTGKILWSIPYLVTYDVSIATPIYHENIVFVSGYWEGSKAIQLGAQPGDAKLLWEDNRNLRGLMSQPLYRDGFVYSLDKVHGLTCFELKTGKKRWDDKEHQMTARGQNPQASLVWLDAADRAIVFNEAGKLILAHLNPQKLEADAGPTILENGGNPLWAHPAYSGSRVYARSDSQLISVELPVAR